MTNDQQVVIIGGGPAGLTAAYELTRLDLRPLVLEKQDKVGGLARTETYQGFYFDMGGHRFFTKVEEVRKMWEDVLGDNFLRRPRLSRIYYNGRFFYYPLKLFNVLFNLGLFESLRIMLSYLRWQLAPYQREDTFEQWVTNRFGKRLYQTFFKTYTEKVWGISCSELKAEWAAQRIKDLSVKTALLSMIRKPRHTIKTLIEEFHYPRRGPGMMWTLVQQAIEQRRGAVRLNCDVVKINRTGKRIESLVISSNGQEEIIGGTHFISTMPVSELIKQFDPPAPPEALQSAATLKYRDFLTVCLIVNQPDLFPDNWIYIHDPGVRVGRIQNFKNWSPEMVPDSAKTSLGLEYFCTVGDDLWTRPDADLIELGKRELERIGLARAEDIKDGCVFRVPNAYPVYDSDYRHHLAVVREFVDGLENLQTIGRNGLHRYNNQDHAMLTGMLAVRNLMLGEKNDLWSVNTDQMYHEEIREVDVEKAEKAIEEALVRIFPKLDRVAFGLSVGVVFGLVIFLATLLLVLKGGEVVGPHLRLLRNYFPGYRVTWLGSVLGLGYGFFAGFLLGWTWAFLRNTSVFLTMLIIHRRAEWQLLRRLSDFL
jgi:protoporphyrinogen oxidase